MFNDWSNLELGRAKRARDNIKLFNVSPEMTHAECTGSKGDLYVVDDMECSCIDHVIKRMVCKHMIALAALRGDIDLNRIVEEGETRKKIAECKDEVAKAFGHYYLFGAPTMDDKEYDKLKKKLAKLEAKLEEICK